ncbi:hypothetical protein ASC59_08305 [Leifsonia sp. Root1293]|nr:hypothetical protein ASC59_08305 [Leifsonia sp. Root1293]KRA12782.1 hypothetical protein ASD61_08305 [Leifsonia sp. Root60]
MSGFLDTACEPLLVSTNKVPEITAAFWITKILTTGMGETTSDFLVHQIDPPVAVAVTGILLVCAVSIQLTVRRYVVWVYWLAVLMVSVFGTMVADVVHVQFGIPYAVSTAFFALLLTAIFVTWFRTQGTLSIHAIDSRPRELFYWATVVTTFALGTAAGDLLATTLGLGFLAGGIVFAVLFAIPGVGYLFGAFGGTFAFWAAYVLTRPFGASMADWVALPPDRGGLGLGTGPVSLVLLVAIIGMVIHLTAAESRRPRVASSLPALEANAG